MRKNTFTSFSFFELITSVTEKEKQIPSLFEKSGGDTSPLLNDEGLNAFALVARENSDKKDEEYMNYSFYSPYLFRTYKLPGIC